jgi:hypothetical protein
MLSVAVGEIRIGTFIKDNAHKLMTAFIVIHTLITITFVVLYLTSDKAKENSINYNLYVCSLVLILISFMIHFAYHSVSKYFLILYI